MSGKKNCMECFLILSVGCFYLALIAAIISYYVFGIKFIVEDYNIAKECKDSHLLYAILVILIYGILNLIFQKKKDEDNHTNLLFPGLLNLGLAIWLGLELFKYSCDNLSDTNLWTFGFVQFILLTISSGLILLYIIFSPLYVCLFHHNKEVDNKDNINNIV